MPFILIHFLISMATIFIIMERMINRIKRERAPKTAVALSDYQFVLFLVSCIFQAIAILSMFIWAAGYSIIYYFKGIIALIIACYCQVYIAKNGRVYTYPVEKD